MARAPLTPWWTACPTNEVSWTPQSNPRDGTLDVYTLVWKPAKAPKGPATADTPFPWLVNGKIRTRRLIIQDHRYSLEPVWTNIVEAKLEHLELRLHDADPTLAETLAKVLENTRDLKSLIITGASDANAHGFNWSHFTPGFAVNTTLTSLSVGRIGMDMQNFHLLSTVISSKPLLSLHLWKITPLPPEPARKLVMSILPGLVSLNLGGITLNRQEWVDLAAALPTARLKRLSLWQTSPGTNGCTPFFKALAHNATISTLLFNVNTLEDSSVQLLGDVLRTNTTLRYLDISECGLNDRHGRVLVDSLAVNTSLRSLILDLNPGISTQRLAEMLLNNRGLTYFSCAVAYARGDVRLLFSVLDAIEENPVIRSIHLEPADARLAENVSQMRGLLFATHPSLIDFRPKPNPAIVEHFLHKKHRLSAHFAELIGALLLLFGVRQSTRPASGTMAALPFEILAQIIFRATDTTFNVTYEQIHALLELLSTQHATIRAQLRSKRRGGLSFIERERAITINGKQVVRTFLDLWLPDR